MFMLIFEPILGCITSKEVEKGLFTQVCSESEDKTMAYSVLSMLAMLLYFALLIV